MRRGSDPKPLPTSLTPRPLPEWSGRFCASRAQVPRLRDTGIGTAVACSPHAEVGAIGVPCPRSASLLKAPGPPVPGAARFRVQTFVPPAQFIPLDWKSEGGTLAE
jgi:hypothetical protein